ncbi:MAG TPA: hypothetical protein VNK24_02335 [Elusimicrobiota bacterium]|nr:hypothetical protein [Elusimicrobiota bacterium]
MKRIAAALAAAVALGLSGAAFAQGGAPAGPLPSAGGGKPECSSVEDRGRASLVLLADVFQADVKGWSDGVTKAPSCPRSIANPIGDCIGWVPPPGANVGSTVEQQCLQRWVSAHSSADDAALLAECEVSNGASARQTMLSAAKRLSQEQEWSVAVFGRMMDGTIGGTGQGLPAQLSEGQYQQACEPILAIVDNLGGKAKAIATRMAADEKKAAAQKAAKEKEDAERVKEGICKWVENAGWNQRMSSTANMPRYSLVCASPKKGGGKMPRHAPGNGNSRHNGKGTTSNTAPVPSAAQPAQMSSFADTTSYLMVPSQDAGDMYLDGAEKEKVCWPETEGGGCRLLALKVVSSVGAKDQANVGKVQGNYISIVDYTDPNDIFQQTFPAVSGSHDFYLDDRDSQHLKYHFKIDIDQDGGITLSRVDTKPLTKKKGFWGSIENFFGGLLHGETATPVAYTSAAQLYSDRNDEIKNRPATQITLGGQKFHIISQGGPHGCLLFFAVGSDGSLLAGPNDEAPGYKPDLMACVNHVGGDGMSEMIGGPQCLGTYPNSGDLEKSYSIEWEPQSASAGTNFKIIPLAAPQTGACQPPQPKGDGTKPDDKKPDGPQTPTQPANGKCASGEVLQGGQCCPSGTALQGDQCVQPDSGQNQCEFKLNGENASDNDKIKVKDLSDGYSLYVKGNGQYYSSYICKGGALFDVLGLVDGGFGQSANGEIGVTVVNAQSDSGVKPQSLADITIHSGKDAAEQTMPEYYARTQDGQSLQVFNDFPLVAKITFIQNTKSGMTIYNLPSDVLTGVAAPKGQAALGDKANSIEMVDPGSKAVAELDVYPHGGSVEAAVKNAVDNYLKNADQEKVTALRSDENGILEKQLSKIPGDAIVEIYLQGRSVSGATGCSPAVGASYSEGGKQVDKTLVDYEFAHASGGRSVTLVPFMARCEPKK